MTPAAALSEKVRSMLAPGDHLAICTDSDSYADTVLLAIARPTGSCVLSVPRRVYCGFTVLAAAGLADPLELPEPKKNPDPATLLKEIRHARRR